MAHIQDFGEKIGGARKDVWKTRGMITSDLTDMTDLERDNLIKKDNVWLRPNWEQLIADGVPQCVAFWQNEMRKSIPPKPKNSDEHTQDCYVSVVGELRDAVMAVKTPEDIDRFYKGSFRDKFLDSHPGSRYVSVKSDAIGVVNSKVLSMAQSSSYSMTRKAEKKLFGIPKDEQTYVSLKKRMEIHRYDGDSVQLKPYERENDCTVLTIGNAFGRSYYYMRKDNPYQDINKWEKGTFFVMDTGHGKPLAINLSSQKEAQDYIEAFARNAQTLANERTSNSKGTGARKGAFVPPQLKHIKRTGPDYRNQFHTKGEMFLTDLKFRGGEFGNWMNEADRQTSLDMGYDALRDLARILNIRPEDVSLNSTLAIAFGARGRGGANAGLAHYEPDRQVINLTKMSGAGCLAHEWGHALDHAIGISCGFRSLASEGKVFKTPDSFQDVLYAMRYKQAIVQPEEQSIEVQKQLDISKRNLRNWIDSAKPSDLPPDMKETWDTIKEQIVSSASTFKGVEYRSYGRGDQVVTKPEVEMLSQIRKTFTNHVIPKDTKLQIALWAMEIKKHEKDLASLKPKERRVKTEFYKGSIAFDEMFSKHSHGYWQSECEMFARAFDCYISDKLETAGVRSDYLSGHANTYVSVDGDGNRIAAIPLGEERKLITKKMEALILDLKERGILHNFTEPEITISEHPKPAKETAKQHAPENHDKPMHYEQMSFEALLFSAESRRQETAQKKAQSQDLSR